MGETEAAAADPAALVAEEEALSATGLVAVAEDSVVDDPGATEVTVGAGVSAGAVVGKVAVTDGETVTDEIP